MNAVAIQAGRRGKPCLLRPASLAPACCLANVRQAGQPPAIAARHTGTMSPVVDGLRDKLVSRTSTGVRCEGRCGTARGPREKY